jgi:hypothetical protein
VCAGWEQWVVEILEEEVVGEGAKGEKVIGYNSYGYEGCIMQHVQFRNVKVSRFI